MLGLCASSMGQQIPNGNFESWPPGTSGDRAQNWLNTDDVISSLFGISVTTATTSASPDSHSGSYAAKLETKYVSPLGPTPGYLILGTSMGNDMKLPGGLPFTTRPAAMQLHYKLSGPNLTADSATAVVLLTRWVNGRSRLIAEGEQVLAGAAAYTLATVPLQYHSALMPDSIHIMIASGVGDVLTVGTTLYVDDIAMTNVATATQTTPGTFSIPSPVSKKRMGQS